MHYYYPIKNFCFSQNGLFFVPNKFNMPLLTLSLHTLHVCLLLLFTAYLSITVLQSPGRILSLKLNHLSFF